MAFKLKNMSAQAETPADETETVNTAEDSTDATPNATEQGTEVVAKKAATLDAPPVERSFLEKCRSRRGHRIAVLLIVGGTIAGLQLDAFFGVITSPSDRADSSAQGIQDLQDDAGDTTTALVTAAPAVLAINLDTVLDDAANFKSATGSFAGFSASNVMVAASTNNIVVSATIGTTCLFSGIIEGSRNAVLSDPSGSACDTGLVARAQEALNAADMAEPVPDQDGVAVVVQAVSEAAALWSQMTFNPETGGPSLAGFTAPYAGAVIESIEPSGTYASVRVTSGQACTIAVVFAHADQPVQQTPC